MGMVLYGQTFTLYNPAEHGLNAPASGPGRAGELTRSAGVLAYYEVSTIHFHSVKKCEKIACDRRPQPCFIFLLWLVLP